MSAHGHVFFLCPHFVDSSSRFSLFVTFDGPVAARLGIVSKYMEEIKSRKNISKEELDRLSKKMHEELKREEEKIRQEVESNNNSQESSEKFAKDAEESAIKSKEYAEVAEKGECRPPLYLHAVSCVWSLE